MKVKALLKILKESNPDKSVFVLLNTPDGSKEIPIQTIGEVAGTVQINVSIDEM